MKVMPNQKVLPVLSQALEIVHELQKNLVLNFILSVVTRTEFLLSTVQYNAYFISKAETKKKNYIFSKLADHAKESGTVSGHCHMGTSVHHICRCFWQTANHRAARTSLYFTMTLAPSKTNL
jgi:hypothetical protein